MDVSKRIICLTQERWIHIQKHSEMAGKMEKIKEALIKPTIVHQASRDSSVRYYYKHDKEQKKYLFVSVKYLNHHGFIITSFYTDTTL